MDDIEKRAVKMADAIIGQPPVTGLTIIPGFRAAMIKTCICRIAEDEMLPGEAERYKAEVFGRAK